MNKLRLLFALTVFSIITVSCDKNNDNNETSTRDKFLVDKIYDSDNNLLAEYIYDNDNRLIKTIEKNFQNEMDELEFEYKNGRVSKIIRHYSYIQTFLFDQESHHETHFFYNPQGRLIRTEFHAGKLTMSEDYLYENGCVASIYSEDFRYDVDTFFYDKSKNVTKHIRIFSDLIFEDPIIGEIEMDPMTTYYFKYDNRPKPNFGLDYLFVYEPLPLNTGTWGSFERNLSKNNMTETTMESGRYIEKSSWTYTYNENGLPSTIEIKNEGIAPPEPAFLRITYKQIK